mmetsp:Transcript_6749/g.16296  ORF Transcript_6749/g.16296 Transcript_6749/m.16296 type:complete len:239 (+) Transcript_6749:168-884(+)
MLPTPPQQWACLGLCPHHSVLRRVGPSLCCLLLPRASPAPLPSSSSSSSVSCPPPSSLLDDARLPVEPSFSLPASCPASSSDASHLKSPPLVQTHPRLSYRVSMYLRRSRMERMPRVTLLLLCVPLASAWSTFSNRSQSSSTRRSRVCIASSALRSLTLGTGASSSSSTLLRLFLMLKRPMLTALLMSSMPPLHPPALTMDSTTSLKSSICEGFSHRDFSSFSAASLASASCSSSRCT